MQALVVKAVGGGFDLEDVQIAAPMGREVLVDVQASGLCHTYMLFATHDIVPMPAVLGHEIAGIVAEVGPDVALFRIGLQGRMNLDDLVSKKIALRDVNDGYAALKDGSLNCVVVTSFEE
jgi:Zn-dependent alcohol dehydrogenase